VFEGPVTIAVPLPAGGGSACRVLAMCEFFLSLKLPFCPESSLGLPDPMAAVRLIPVGWASQNFICLRRHQTRLPSDLFRPSKLAAFFLLLSLRLNGDYKSFDGRAGGCGGGVGRVFRRPGAGGEFVLSRSFTILAKMPDTVVFYPRPLGNLCAAKASNFAPFFPYV